MNPARLTSPLVLYRWKRPLKYLILAWYRLSFAIHEYPIRRRNNLEDHDHRWNASHRPVTYKCPNGWIIFNVYGRIFLVNDICRNFPSVCVLYKLWLQDWTIQLSFFLFSPFFSLNHFSIFSFQFLFSSIFNFDTIGKNFVTISKISFDLIYREFWLSLNATWVEFSFGISF